MLYANLADEERSPQMNYEQNVAAEIVKVLREHGITVPDDKTMLDAIAAAAIRAVAEWNLAYNNAWIYPRS